MRILSGIARLEVFNRHLTPFTSSPKQIFCGFSAKERKRKYKVPLLFNVQVNSEFPFNLLFQDSVSIDSASGMDLDLLDFDKSGSPNIEDEDAANVVLQHAVAEDADVISEVKF